MYSCKQTAQMNIILITVIVLSIQYPVQGYNMNKGFPSSCTRYKNIYMVVYTDTLLDRI